MKKSFKERLTASNLAKRSIQMRTEDHGLKIMGIVEVVRKNYIRLNGQKKLLDIISVWFWALSRGISGII